MAVAVTLTTLATDLGHILDDENARAYSLARKTKFINMAMNHVSQILQSWGGKALVVLTDITSIVDQIEYAIAAETMQIEHVAWELDDATYRELQHIPFATKLQHDTKENGTPTVFYRRGAFIGVLPKPDTAGRNIRVYSSKMQDDLTGSAALALPPWCRNMILYKAAALIVSTKGDDKVKRLFENDFAQERNEFLITVSRWQRMSPDYVQKQWELEFTVGATATFSA